MLSHIRKLLLEPYSLWSSLAIYWIGLPLRQYNPNFASLRIPHSEFIPPFYKICYTVFKEFMETFPAVDFLQQTTKHFYTLLMSKVVTPSKVEKIYPQINFSLTWLDINSKFLEPHTNTLCWKIVHQVLPVNYDWWKRNVSKTSKCNFCPAVETISHLFCECPIVLPLWNIIFAYISTISSQNIPFSSNIIIFNQLPLNISKHRRTLSIYLISSAKSIIWKCRNVAQYHKKSITANGIITSFIFHLRYRILIDHYRLLPSTFIEFWRSTDLFCHFDENNKIAFDI